MFRLFLKKKLLEADPSESAANPTTDSSQRNRRVFTRYSVDHKHLTLMNEQDILLIREISAKGFSTMVSDRGFQRLKNGDVYDARMRYLGEIYDLEARVAWKEENIVGFEIVKAEKSTLQFIRRLLRPVEIAASMQEVESKLLNQSSAGKIWLHGDEESDLYIWPETDLDRVKAWQLAVGDHYVEWTNTEGLSSGVLTPIQGQEILMGANLQGLTHRRDTELDSQKKQLAVDILMALDHEFRDRILETITE